MKYSEAFAILKELGAGEFAHLNGNLEAHLIGTHDLLRDWGNTEYVCAAGLYHAVYGTDGLQSGLVELCDRPRISSIIGPESEELVYLYAACDRKYVYPQVGRSKNVVLRDRFTGDERCLDSRELKDLFELTLANELEIVSRDPVFLNKHRKWYEELFDRFSGIVSQRGFTHYRQVFGKGT